MMLPANGRTTLWAASLLHGHAAFTNGKLQPVSDLDLLKRMEVNLPDVHLRNCTSDPSA
jgi:hypothetical protein